MKATIAVFCCLVFTGLVVSAPAQQALGQYHTPLRPPIPLARGNSLLSGQKSKATIIV